MKLEMTVPGNCVGRVIGKGGAKIKEMTATSGAHLKIIRQEDVEDVQLQVAGNLRQIQAAQYLVWAIVAEHAAQ